MSNIKAVVIAAVSQVIVLAVAFGVIDNTTAQALTAAAGSLVNAAFVIGAAIESHGKTVAAGRK